METARFSGTSVATRRHIAEDINLQVKKRMQCISHEKQYKWIENFHGKHFWNDYFDDRVKDGRITLRWNIGTQVVRVNLGFRS
jgi:hypothetical protein